MNLPLAIALLLIVAGQVWMFLQLKAVFQMSFKALQGMEVLYNELQELKQITITRNGKAKASNK